jgi:hypothetical protein
MADRAVKQNVVRVGTHPLGIGLYLFDYRAECHTTAPFWWQFGVMADKVEAWASISRTKQCIEFNT